MAALLRLGLASALLAAPLAAQHVQGAIVPARSVRAGITVLEHDAAALRDARQLVVEDTPVTQIGGARGDPALDLTEIRHVALLADGRLAVLDQRASHVLVFGRDGKSVRTIGRRGAGPAEFRGALSLARIAGDTLVVPDFANMRMNWLVADRGFARTEPLDDRVTPSPTRFAGALPNGRMIMTTSGLVAGARSGKRERTTAAIIALPPRGRAQVIARVPDIDIVAVETRYEGKPATETRGVSLSRYAHVAVWDTLVIAAWGDGYRIALYNGTGRQLTELVVNVPRRVVTPAMRRATVDEQLAQLAAYRERPRDPAESQRLIREAPFADSLPPYAMLSVSPNQTLWVVDAIAPGDTVWSATAFRKDGAIIGRVTSRLVGRPVAFGDASVVLRRTDADGLVSFEVRRIVPAR